MADWFTQMAQMYSVVQHQATLIQTLHERVAVLESRAHIVPPVAVAPAVVTKDAEKKAKKPRAKKVAKAATTADATLEPGASTDAAAKKRGRKPTATVPLSSFLREGEQVIARIPLGDRKFDEHSLRFQDGQLVLEDGQRFDHPTTMAGALAKMLEDIGERSTECSKSLNGWGLCYVYRNGKRISLETFKIAASQANSVTSEEPSGEVVADEAVVAEEETDEATDTTEEEETTD